MSDENVKKRLRDTKRELLEEKRIAEIQIKSDKKHLRRTKRKIKQLDEVLRKI